MKYGKKRTVRLIKACLSLLTAFALTAVSAAALSANSADSARNAFGATEKYSITLPTVQTGYTLHSKQAGQTEVAAGEDYTFVFGVESNYSQSAYNVYVNGERIDVTGGEYTIRKVFEPLVITVDGITINKYYVTLPKAEEQKGYTLTYAAGGEIAEAGDEVAVRFTVTDQNAKARYLLYVNGAGATVGADGVYRATAYGDMLFTVEYKKPVKVNFNANGGAGQISGGRYYAYGETVPLDMTPEINKDGYIFYGWSENPSAARPEYRDGAETAFIAGDESQVTLYAIWKAADAAEPEYPARFGVWGLTGIFGGAALLVLIIAIIYGSVRKSKMKKAAESVAEDNPDDSASSGGQDLDGNGAQSNYYGDNADGTDGKDGFDD